MKVIPSYMRTAKFAKTVRFCQNPLCGKPMLDVNPNRGSGTSSVSASSAPSLLPVGVCSKIGGAIREGTVRLLFGVLVLSLTVKGEFLVE